MCVSVSLKCRWLINSLIPNYIHRKLLQVLKRYWLIIIELLKIYEHQMLTKSFVDMYIQLKKPQNSRICLVLHNISIIITCDILHFIFIC